jgi:hypothetical protein
MAAWSLAGKLQTLPVVEEVFSPVNTLAVEPGIYMTRLGGVRSEDLLVGL